MEAGNRLAERYQLDKRLGQGGMGQVWRAFDERLQRPVAVKLLSDRVDDPRLVSRFRREATIGARLQHPGITVVHDAGHDRGRLFIVMELLDGRDLASLLAESPNGLPSKEAVRLGVQIASALSAAHDQEVVHRDLKPANVFLHRGRVKICDFGISRSVDSTRGLTDQGQHLGTALYMAPEQWRGDLVDTRCDLYAFGCVLYAMLTGNPPFSGDYFALMRQHTGTAPRPPRMLRPEIPRPLEELVLTLLAKAPQGRPADARTVLSALTAIITPPRPSPKPETGTALMDHLLQQARTAGASGPARARDLAGAVAEAAIATLGPDHPKSIEARFLHADWVGAAGSSETARDLMADLIESCSRVFGSDDRATLGVRRRHTEWVAVVRDWATAHDLNEALIADYARVLGPDDRETLIALADRADMFEARAQQARSAQAAGDLSIARDLFEALITDRARAFGPNDPDTLLLRRFHAELVGDEGDYATARDLIKALISDYIRVLGPDDLQTLALQGIHASWAQEANRLHQG